MDYRKSSFGLILLLGLYGAPAFPDETTNIFDPTIQYNSNYQGNYFNVTNPYAIPEGIEVTGINYSVDIRSYDNAVGCYSNCIDDYGFTYFHPTGDNQEYYTGLAGENSWVFDYDGGGWSPWTTLSGHYDVDNKEITEIEWRAYGIDRGYWGGYYGPQFTNVVFTLEYEGEPEPEPVTLIQFTNDGICDFTAIDDPDCVVIEEETFVVDQIFGDENNENNENTNNYGEDWEIVNESIEEPVDNSNSDSTIASDGQDSGNIVGDTGENIVYITEEPEMVEQPEMEVIVEQEQTIIDIDIDPNALLQSDTLFSKNQQSSSFRRSINSRSINHLNSVGGLPQIGATSAETYTMMQNSASMNGVMMSEALSLDPSKMLLPSNPMDPTGTGIVVSDSTGVMNGYNPMNNYDNFKFDQSGNEFNDIVASISSPIEEVELVESLDIDDLGNLDISDFNQIQLKDNNNWYSNSNILEQSGIYQDQEFYKQQEIYKGVRWYGNN